MTQAYTLNRYNHNDLSSPSTKENPNTSNSGINNTMDTSNLTADEKSYTSGGGRSARGSAVLQRAKEYNRLIDENKSREGSQVGIKQGQVYSKTTSDSALTGKSSSSQLNTHTPGKGRTPNSINHQQQHSNQPNRNQNSKHYVQNQRSGQNATSGGKNISPNSNKENNKHYSSPGTNDNSKHNHHNAQVDNQQQQAVVTPELLVDALSGHEDGLLAIAERLMEHYDSGYDVMGEAIIDAFADVQKLFQHVVEAAHMEGAAYEAGRKEEEITRLKQALENHGGGDVGYFDSPTSNGQNVADASSPEGEKSSALHSSGPLRHEEFIDQDVREILLDAIKMGQGLKDVNQQMECYTLYEQACNSASALLPVDSDHRGRLQLSIARAESMNPERACAILKYVMDDVLRSGLGVNSKVVMPDPSQRGDCVLRRQDPLNRSVDDYSVGGRSPSKLNNSSSTAAEEGVVTQSSEEALASLVEEMKEIIGAPVYDNTPIQNVSERFWSALSEAQKINQKKEERLEQNLATLKGEFLLEREEWEEKFNSLSRNFERLQKKLDEKTHTDFMHDAKNGISTLGRDHRFEEDEYSEEGDRRSPRGNRAASSVGSFASLSQHARSMVGSFSTCAGGSKGEMRERRGFRGKLSRLQSDASPPPSLANTSGTSSARKNEFHGLNHPPPPQNQPNPNFVRRGPRTDF